jgi:hypothetical protein
MEIREHCRTKEQALLEFNTEGLVAGSYEHSNVTSGSIKGGICLGKQNDYRLPNRNSASWSWLMWRTIRRLTHARVQHPSYLAGGSSHFSDTADYTRIFKERVTTQCGTHFFCMHYMLGWQKHFCVSLFISFIHPLRQSSIDLRAFICKYSLTENF